MVFTFLSFGLPAQDEPNHGEQDFDLGKGERLKADGLQQLVGNGRVPFRLGHWRLPS